MKSILGLLLCVTSLAAQLAPIKSDEAIAIEKRNKVLHDNFSKFRFVKFEMSNGVARLHRLDMKANRFDYDGLHYTGFKFTVPQWADGNFEWFFLLAKTERQKDFTADKFLWYIIPERGNCEGFTHFTRMAVSSYSNMQVMFPYTKVIIEQALPTGTLKAGETYGIWFAHNQDDFPDIAFSIWFDSKRGLQECGVPILALRDNRTVATAIRERSHE